MWWNGQNLPVSFDKQPSQYSVTIVNWFFTCQMHKHQIKIQIYRCKMRQYIQTTKGCKMMSHPWWWLISILISFDEILLSWNQGEYLCTCYHIFVVLTFPNILLMSRLHVQCTFVGFFFKYLSVGFLHVTCPHYCREKRQNVLFTCTFTFFFPHSWISLHKCLSICHSMYSMPALCCLAVWCPSSSAEPLVFFLRSRK